MLRLALITTDNREDRRDYSPAHPWFGTAPQALLDGFASIPEEIEVHIISCTREHLESPLRLAPNITFHSVHVPAWTWLKLGYLGNILAIRRCLKPIQPDIVHGQGCERDCAISAVFSGYPNLITLHGNMRRLAKLSGARPWSFPWITALLESLAVRLSCGIICLSKHTQELVAPLAKKTWLIPNAVDPAFLNIQPPETPKPPLILMVGDVTPNKNPLAFLKAITPLQSEFAFTVKLFGKFDPTQPYTAELLDFTAQNPWCISGGFLNRESLKQEMASATLLALPSLEENLPMVILEAMAVGLPVAASAVGGIPDLIADGKTGRLFDPKDAESMRSTLRSILADPTNRRNLATQARQKIHHEHLPPSIARRHQQIYQEILACRKIQSDG
jgi:glycosyltransferase involved in cell wall biosynthesis